MNGHVGVKNFFFIFWLLTCNCEVGSFRLVYTPHVTFNNKSQPIQCARHDVVCFCVGRIHREWGLFFYRFFTTGPLTGTSSICDFTDELKKKSRRRWLGWGKMVANRLGPTLLVLLVCVTYWTHLFGDFLYTLTLYITIRLLFRPPFLRWENKY